MTMPVLKRVGFESRYADNEYIKARTPPKLTLQLVDGEMRRGYSGGCKASGRSLMSGEVAPATYAMAGNLRASVSRPMALRASGTIVADASKGDTQHSPQLLRRIQALPITGMRAVGWRYCNDLPPAQSRQLVRQAAYRSFSHLPCPAQKRSLQISADVDCSGHSIAMMVAAMEH